MSHQTPASRFLAALSLAAVAGMVVAACGSSAPAPRPSKTATPSEAPTGAAAQSAVAANWAAFFSAKTPVTRRVALLQDGQVFASVIKSQASSPLATLATANVTKVALVSPTQATVTYSILVSGKPALSNQKGVAVYQDGTWKVGVTSFCGLLALENGGKTSSLPAACRTAG